MAVRLNNASRLSALALALASLTLPGIAAAKDNDNRGGWRNAEREDRGGSRGEGNRDRGNDGRGRDDGGWQQRGQAPAPQPAPRAEWSQRSSPAPQAATPPAPSRAAWGRDGGNRRNWEGRGNREARGGDDRGGDERRGWEGRGNRGWQGNAPAAQVPAPTRDTRWSGRGSRDGDVRRDGDGRRDGSWRSQGGSQTWGSGSHGWNDRDRDGRRDGDRWRDNDRHRDGDRWRDNDRHRDGDRWRDNNRHGWNDRDRDHRRWDRHWRSNNRYNWYSHRSHYPQYYRLGSYYSPYRHYRYRRLNIGFFLDSLFYSNRYWIADPWHYRLPEAYGPYRWVRYYDDALLVNIHTGEVVDVIHNFFW